MARGLLLVPALALAIAGCPRACQPPAPPTPSWLRALAWPDHPDLLGVSGAALRAPGEVWLAPERSGRLLSVSWDGTKLGPPIAHPIEGLPEGLDVEGLDFLDGERLVLATESQAERTEDPIYLAALEGGRVRVEGRFELDYRGFGIQVEKNRGLEGVCVAASYVVAASEAVRTTDGVREAPLGIWSADEDGLGPMRGVWVRLTSERGKLSALSCERTEVGLVVHAIERHFGTLRLVRVDVPLPVPSSPPQLSAELVRDLGPVLGPSAPNLEGLTRLGDHRWLVVSDNHYGKRTGPTEAFVLTSP